MIRSPILSVALVAGTCAAGLLLAGPIARALAGGSANGEVIRACYVPASGVVYRIGADGLGDECKGKNHVEFSWSVQGPQGPPGPPGPPGPGLTAQSCPTGEFVVGIDASGSLICNGGESSGGNGGSGGGTTFYFDGDGDGYGDPDVTTVASTPPADHVAEAGDCDDSDASIHPGASDPVGDGVDSDCDGFDGTAGTVVDPTIDFVVLTCTPPEDTWFPDDDGDGYGDPNEQGIFDEFGGLEGFAENDCDCDDSNPNVHPGATEIVNGIDDNCNGTAY